jgi:hypothetical protein
VVAAIAFAAAATPAIAQIGAPIPLIPVAPPASGTSALPPQGQAPAPASAAPGDPGDIEAQPLPPTDASWIGTLDPAEGALPETLWSGTPRAFVAAALPLLPPSASPTLQDLARRLLLSNAVSPAGADEPNRPTLAAERLDRLVALGQVGGALAVMDNLPADPSGDGMDRMRAELRFAAGDLAAACQAADDGVARYQSDWWQRALIACQALQGDGAKAALGLSLLREQKAPPDATFDALVDALAGHPRRIGKLPDPTPMRLAMLAAAKEPLPADALAAAGPAALLAYARSDALPAERRLPAAERAALLGALPPDALGTLYRAVEVKPEEQVAALKDGKPPDDARGRAILFQVARSAAPQDIRRAAISAFFADAQKRGAFPLAARLLAPALGDMDPSAASKPFAADAARALLVTGDDKARTWLDAAGSPALTLLSHIAQGSALVGQDPAGLLQDGVVELASRDSGTASMQADLLVTLLAAFGDTLGKLDWPLLLSPPHDAKLPSAALMIGQQQAIAQKRIGETVLDSILLAGPGERLSLEPVLLGQAIAGLRASGLEGEARALAVEAALDAGI